MEKLKKYQELSSLTERISIDDNLNIPKWKTFEKITVLLPSEHRDAIDELAKNIMRYRSNHGEVTESRERITANSVFRVAILHFLERVDSLDMESIENEEELSNKITELEKEKKDKVILEEEQLSYINNQIPRGERSEFLKITMTMPLDLWMKLKEAGINRKVNKEKNYDISSLLREAAYYWLENIMSVN